MPENFVKLFIQFTEMLFYILVFNLLFQRPALLPDFKEQVIDSSISIGYGIAIGDVDGDKKPDILLADKTQIVWYRNGDWKKFVMAEHLTQFDNVCIAARDLDGDGKVEVAVGAQWNPSETSVDSLSGSVHYLVRPANWSNTGKQSSFRTSQRCTVCAGPKRRMGNITLLCCLYMDEVTKEERAMG